MIITRNSPKGGRPLGLNKFPLAQDKEGNFGVRIGYLETGEPILIALRDTEEFANSFGTTLVQHKKYLTKQPKEHWKIRLAKWFLTPKKYHRIVEELEEGD
jgi:hypothetical protein